jgi:hypothetical protein
MTRVVVIGLFIGGCSSDAVLEPEPSVDTPGAFVAVNEGLGYLSLLRTLDTLDLEQAGRQLIVSRYSVQPHSVVEARELSKDRNLLVGTLADFTSVSVITEQEHYVVWFRTLTREELDRIP